MGMERKKTILALVTFAAFGTAAVAVAGKLQPVHVAVSDLKIQYLCGPTPVPGTPSSCPDVSTLNVHYAGQGCTSDDFVVRVREGSAVQYATILKRKSATECFVSDDGFAGAPLASVELVTHRISPYKPVKFTNLFPVRLDPRP